MPPPSVSRRHFLAVAASGLLVPACRSGPEPGDGIIDTHTHFYDPTRPRGVAWPPADEPRLYRPILPAEYRRLAEPLGITGTVVVEASPREEDNDWVLELMAREPLLLGLVGHLKPGRIGFLEGLRRYGRNPLFRGIRTGGWNVPLAPTDAAFRRDCRELARRNLVLDVLVSPGDLHQVAGLAEAVPDLRLVVDHCANVRVDGAAPPREWLSGLDACARNPGIHLKVSGLVEGTGRNDGTARADPALYRPVLDAVWERFGPDRVLFGSNWPVSSMFAPLTTVHQIAGADAITRGENAAQRFFHRNAIRVYQLRPRTL